MKVTNMPVTRFAAINELVRDQAIACGRKPDEVRLIAVSKTVDAKTAYAAFGEGARDFGENRPECLCEKALAVSEANWHFIGNIQSRRIPDIVGSATLIHSLCKSSHADKVSSSARMLGKTQDVLIEVNVSGETSKGGCHPEDALELVQYCCALPNVRVCGLMTMAPQGDAEVAYACFEQLAALKSDIHGKLNDKYAQSFVELSMGMSEDWREAVRAGSTMVRIGRAIFSEAFEDARV